MKKILAILDREAGYAARLMEVFNSKERLGFQAEMFTGVAAFADYSRKNHVEILLIGDSMMEENLRGMADTIIIISEGIKVAELQTYPVIYKYQSSEMTIQNIFEIYAKEGKTSEVVTCKKCDVVGVYAPERKEAASVYAWELAKKLAQNKRVLFLYMGTFGEKDELYKGDKDLADIMYYVNYRCDNLVYMVSSAVRNLEGVDCMPAMSAPDDLISVPVENWLKLLQTITTQGGYETIIIVVEECVQQFYRVLDFCTEVIFPAVRFKKNIVKWDTCEEYFRRMGVEEVWKKGRLMEINEY